MKSPILLSVLIPSIPRRIEKLTFLIECLERQDHPQLEVIVMLDNCRRSLGEKRNAMMREAHGKFCAHIDDDEMLSSNYFELLLPELQHDVDLVAYDATCSLNGSIPFRVNTGIGFENEQPKSIGENQYSDIKRTPWHWCCWRTELARTCPFPEHHDGAEDAYFLNQILPKVATHRKLNKAIFHHRYDAKDTTFSTE